MLDTCTRGGQPGWALAGNDIDVSLGMRGSVHDFVYGLDANDAGVWATDTDRTANETVITLVGTFATF